MSGKKKNKNILANNVKEKYFNCGEQMETPHIVWRWNEKEKEKWKNIKTIIIIIMFDARPILLLFSNYCKIWAMQN